MGVAPAYLLTHEHVASIVSTVGLDRFMDQLIERLEVAFRDFDVAKTKIPIRDGFSYQVPHMGLLEWMPILHSGQEMLMKLVGYHPENPDKYQLPTILSSFSLYNSRTGLLKAIVDGTLVTALRTGAASALASRKMGWPESVAVGLIGCGAQAVTQLHALSRIFNFQTVYFYDTDKRSVDSFPDRCSSFGFSGDMIAAKLDDVVKNADVLCIATSVDVGAGPVFRQLGTKSHLHINAVGSDFPGKVEVPVELLRQAYVSPDCLEQAVKEGECQQLKKDEIGLPLTELLKAEANDLQEQLTVFDSTGWALEDLVVTQLVLEYAQEHGIGEKIEIVADECDPKNPYESLERHPQESAKVFKVVV